jgi:hypothetical protein
MNKKETMIKWMMKAYRRHCRGKTAPLMAVNAEMKAASRLHLTKLKLDKALYPNLYLKSWKSIFCPLIIPISTLQSHTGKRKPWAEVGITTGAYVFRFASKGKRFSALYACWEHGNRYEPMAVAAIPFGRVQEWHQFEESLRHALDLKPTHQKAYVVGSSYNGDFKPTVTLNDVILSDEIKQHVVTAVDEFFRTGIETYREMGVPPFRKYLLYGEPGNGKSMLAMALAADQLKKRRVVVFVSASDRCGADFNKIQKALEIARTNKFPVFIVVEEIDSYVTNPGMRAQVLDVLDGFEAPNNPKGAVLLMTSNHPERLDNAILRFGRIDQRWKIPPIETINDSRLLLQQYLGDMYELDGNATNIEQRLIGKPRVFVRELSFSARLRAAAAGDTCLDGHLATTLRILEKQVLDGEAFLHEDKPPVGFLQRQPVETDELFLPLPWEETS